ncbi:FprA family A-type flavoprotein [Treponema pectinovorum]|uniref:FprA family A-type flavoprotein n=1 Tax=Treponema pectinovorum TaxID=164 RepID=UPI0011CBD532|nr:FprA family A-type flavoprotein [Treponema pectinovorum]
MEISDSIKYVGVSDKKHIMFESQFDCPKGMSYNSYVILDEKIAVLDSVDADFGDEWIANLKEVLKDRKPDYLVVHHMEMDHSSNIMKFIECYPEAKIVASKVAFTMMKNMFFTDFPEKQVVVGEGSKLELGKHCLNFITAQNVHWPEVIMGYESSEKVMFTADGFGKFGAIEEGSNEEWKDEARRYYFAIVGKFGQFVQAVLKKLPAFEIKKICSLHGPVLDSNIGEYVKSYDIWSSYAPEEDGVFIAYTSVYRNTKKAAELLAKILHEKGCKNVVIADLAREDTAQAIANAFRYSKLVLASTTYCNGVFPKMREFIEHLAHRNFQKRMVAFVENGTWAPSAAKTMTTLLEPCKDLSILPEKVTIKITMTEENKKQLENLATQLLA